MRKNVLKYDDVMNRQREVVYSERREVLEGADISSQVATFMEDTITAYVTSATAGGFPENWDLETLWQALKLLYPISFTIDEVSAEVGGVAGLDSEFLLSKVLSDARAAYAKREETLGVEVVRELERKVLLSVLDRKWREHLYEMDYLQEGIGLRAMAQRDPLVEYQKEGYELFSAMMDGIKEELVALLFNVEVDIQQNDGAVEVTPKGVGAPEQSTVPLVYSAADENGEAQTTGGASRNGPCPCGSGKKYKRCHGAA
jgi:preprotein translocase subunit SecA